MGAPVMLRLRPLPLLFCRCVFSRFLERVARELAALRYRARRWSSLGPAIAVATTEALVIELPLAPFCLWAAHAIPISRSHRRTTVKTHKQGALS
jgi:hypothetical protein